MPHDLVLQHSHSMHAFLAGTHDWFEGVIGRAGKLEADGVRVWGLAALDLAREHSIAITILLSPFRPRYFGSAAALQRPLLEGVLRGYYFSFCQVEESVQRTFEEGRGKLSPDRLLKKIIVAQPQVGQHIKAILPMVETALNRYTHGDAHQISRRLTPRPDSKEPGFSEADAIGILAFTTRMTLFAMIAMLDHAKDKEGCEQVRLRLQELDRLEAQAGDLLEAVYGPRADHVPLKSAQR